MKSKVFNRDYDLLANYCLQHSSPADELLQELERETYLKTLAPQMISGYLQGKLLELLIKLQAPQRVLEIGTFTGYATICMARGLPENGKVISLEINPELQYISNKYFEKAGLSDRIEQRIGDAKVLVKTMDQHFDFIFLDGAKPDYPAIYPDLKRILKPGGCLVVDNVLWGGKMALGTVDKLSKIMQSFNEMVRDDQEVEMIILPVRDGLMMLRKL